MTERDTGRLRQAVARLMEAQEDASNAAKGGLERQGEVFDYEGSSDASGHLEEALVDVVDILEGALSDVRDLLADAADERGE